MVTVCLVFSAAEQPFPHLLEQMAVAYKNFQEMWQLNWSWYLRVRCPSIQVAKRVPTSDRVNGTKVTK